MSRSAASLDGDHDEPVLPPDWVVCMSKRKKRKYYFNQVTGDTSWEPPTCVKAATTPDGSPSHDVPAVSGEKALWKPVSFLVKSVKSAQNREKKKEDSNTKNEGNVEKVSRPFLPRSMTLAQTRKKKKKEEANTENEAIFEKKCQGEIASCSVLSRNGSGTAATTVAKSGHDNRENSKIVVERRTAVVVRRGRKTGESRWSPVDVKVKSTDSKTPGARKTVESHTLGTSRNPWSLVDAKVKSTDSKTPGAKKTVESHTLGTSGYAWSLADTNVKSTDSKTPGATKTVESHTLGTSRNPWSLADTNVKSTDSKTLVAKKTVESHTLGTSRNPWSLADTNVKSTDSKTLGAKKTVESHTLGTSMNPWSLVDANVKSTDSKTPGARKIVESDTPSRNVSRSSGISGEWIASAVPTQYNPAEWGRSPTPTSLAVKSRSATKSGPSPQGSAYSSRGTPSQRNKGIDSAKVCANTNTEDILTKSRKEMTVLCDDTSQGFMRSIMASGGCEWNNAATDFDMEVDMEVDDQTLGDIKEVRQVLQSTSREVLGKLTEKFLEEAPDQSSPVHKSDGGTNVTMETIESKQQDSSASCKKVLYVVVDTNVLIDNLSYLDDLKDEMYAGFGRPHLVIPWVVLQELDTIKDNKRKQVSASTMKKAKDAVNVLHDWFMAKHPRVIGQTPAESCAHMEGLEVTSNDDLLLQCCLKCQVKYADSIVILLTLDKNLRTKAMVMQLITHRTQTLTSYLNSLSGSSEPNTNSITTVIRNDDISMTSKVTRRTSVPSRTTPDKHRVTRRTAPSSVSRSTKEEQSKMDLVLCEVKTVLKKALTAVLELEMKHVYGDLWLDIVYRKPPWSLSDLMDCILKHWIAVFMMVLPNSVKPVVDELQLQLKPCSKFRRSGSLMAPIVDNALQLCSHLRNTARFAAVLTSSVEQLSQLSHTVRSMPPSKATSEICRWTTSVCDTVSSPQCDTVSSSQDDTMSPCVIKGTERKRQNPTSRTAAKKVEVRTARKRKSSTDLSKDLGGAKNRSAPSHSATSDRVASDRDTTSDNVAMGDGGATSDSVAMSDRVAASECVAMSDCGTARRECTTENDSSIVHGAFETIWLATAYFSETLRNRLLDASEIAAGLPTRQEAVRFFAKFTVVLNDIHQAYVASIQALQSEKGTVVSNEAFVQLARALNAFFHQLDVQPCIDVGVNPLMFYFTDINRSQLLQNALDQLQQFMLATEQCKALLSSTELTMYHTHHQNTIGIT